MSTAERFASKDILFIGRGKEWQSFQRYIERSVQPASIESVFIEQGDEEQQQIADIALRQTDSTVFVKTAGYPGSKLTFEYVTPTQIFFEEMRQLGARSVGITGTKGKTTTSSLLAHLLIAGEVPDVRLCGNIGHPMLDALEGASSGTTFIVELSSFQLAEMATSPQVAVLTNLFHDHVDYHGSKEAYWEAKRHIMQFQDESGLFIYDPTTPAVDDWLKDSNTRSFAIDPKESVDAMHQAKLIGDHNRTNYLLARAAAQSLGVDRSVCEAALKTFEPVRHRLQVVKEVGGVTFVDDAIGSNPEATIAGLQALIKNRGAIGCVLLGGVDRGYDYNELVTLLYRVGVPSLVLFPETGQRIKELLPEPYNPLMLETTDMEEAVKWAAKHTPGGSICLLSTAAPSTGLWANFEAKGSLFQQAVLNLPT